MAQTRMVSTSRAVFTIAESSGIRSLLSQMMRTGFLPPGVRQVRSGSSARTVPMPAIIPMQAWRISCTRSLAASPVIHFESPVFAAILPSMVMAYFITT